MKSIKKSPAFNNMVKTIFIEKENNLFSHKKIPIL